MARNRSAPRFTREQLAALEAEFGVLFTGESFDTRNDALISVPTLPLGRTDHGIWGQVIHGYKEAATALAEQAMDGAVPQDLVVYPIVTLYRHYLELLIKHLYLLTGLELDEDTDSRAYGHDLTGLWLAARERLPRVPDIGSLDDLKVVDLVVGSFAQADQRATSFRYPDQVQELVLPTTNGRINLGQLRRLVLKAGHALEGCDGWLLELLFRKAEVGDSAPQRPTG